MRVLSLDPALARLLPRFGPSFAKTRASCKPPEVFSRRSIPLGPQVRPSLSTFSPLEIPGRPHQFPTQRSNDTGPGPYESLLIEFWRFPRSARPSDSAEENSTQFPKVHPLFLSPPCRSGLNARSRQVEGFPLPSGYITSGGRDEFSAHIFLLQFFLQSSSDVGSPRAVGEARERSTSASLSSV